MVIVVVLIKVHQPRIQVAVDILQWDLDLYHHMLVSLLLEQIQQKLSKMVKEELAVQQQDVDRSMVTVLILLTSTIIYLNLQD